MKKLIIVKTCCLVAVFLFTGAFITNAQKAEFGLRYMPTFSAFEMRTSAGNTISGQVSVGFGAGALIGFNFSEHVGLQGEVIYTSISQKYKEADIEREVNLRYFSIPLLISLNTGKTKPVNLNLVAGPQLGISAGSDIHVQGAGAESENTHAILSVKTSDIGFAYGAGIDFGLNTERTVRLGIGFRGVYGLFDISDNSTTVATDSFYILEKTHVKTYSGYIGFSILF